MQNHQSCMYGGAQVSAGHIHTCQDIEFACVEVPQQPQAPSRMQKHLTCLCGGAQGIPGHLHTSRIIEFACVEVLQAAHGTFTSKTIEHPVCECFGNVL